MTIAFQVPDMSCGHCVKTITAAVQAAAPGASVRADLDAHTVVIEGADAALAKKAIEDAGYTARAV